MVTIDGQNPEELVTGALDISFSKEKEGLKLDLACGSNLRPGYVGVDNLPLEQMVSATPRWEGKAPDIYEGYTEVNLLDFPWPFEDSSVAATYSAHFVEHIPHHGVRLNGEITNATDHPDAWWLFFSELYRVLEDGGIAEFVHPFSRSDRADWDPTHTRRIHYQTWLYMAREQRQNLGVNHYAPEVDFDVLTIQSIHEPTALEGRSDSVIEFARSFYWNVTDDLFVVLKANK